MASVLGKRKAPSASATKTSKPTAAASSKTVLPALKKKKSAEGLKKSSATTATKKKTTATKKTKARKVAEDDEEEDTSMLDAQEIFRRHFEAQFKPIEEKSAPKRKKSKAKAEEEEEEDSASGSDEEAGEGEEDIFEDEGADGEEGEGEEWSGLSGDEEDDYDEDSDIPYDDIDENPVIEVVDHTKSNAPPVVSMSKRELKAFMSSKPPSQTDPSPTSLTAAQPPDDPDDENDKSMLANDLALQRLLSESHLLARHAVSPFSNPSNAASKSFSEGKLRQRQTDLRTQSLAGAQGVSGVKSIFVQEKMPMAMRKGIVASTAKREEKRRKTARENGIVLEREAPKKATKKESGGRFGQRGLDGLDVGRMRGAELRLSERDVRNIEGGGGGGRGGGRGGRGGRAGRGGGGRGGHGRR